MHTCCSAHETEDKLTQAVFQRLERGEMRMPSPPMVAASQALQHGLAGESHLSLSTSSSVPFSGSSARDGGEHPTSRQTFLQVPPEFDAVKKSAAGCKDQQLSLQKLIRGFTRSLLRGVCLNVLLDDGRTLLTGAALDSDLTHLVLHVPNMQHPVSLSSIEDLCAPSSVVEAARMMKSLTVSGERCVTLVIRGGQFLTFFFEAPRIREYFEFCFKIVILAGSRSQGSKRSSLASSRQPFADPGDEDLNSRDGFIENV